MGPRRAIGLTLSLTIALACGEDREPPPPRPPPPELEVEAEVDVEPPTTPPEPEPIEPAPPSRVEARGPYQVDLGRDCDGLPALSLDTPEGTCVGLVAHAELPAIAEARGRFRPRSVVTDPQRDDVMWIVDHGARRSRAGRLWRLTRGDDGWDATRIAQRLDRPHGGRVGPDGWIYVGEVQRIRRFDPAADDPAGTMETVVDDLPIALPDRPVRFHPLTSFVFSADGDLIVNMGSGTDRCLEALPADRCVDEARHTGAVWRFARTGPRSWSSEPEYFAHGLRNSVALAAHESGALLQAENGVDFREDSRPHEELNILRRGAHYGWPYCWDRDQRDPEWTHSSFGCEDNPAYTPPHLLLPPHGAPLDMLYYRGAHLGALDGLLLISLHGYRSPGHRVIGLPVGADGLPPADATPTDIIAGWDASDLGPRGSPVGMAQARDGSLWLVEDTNGTVLRMSRDRWAAHRGETRAEPVAAETLEADALFTSLHASVLRPRCAPCHDFIGTEPTGALRAMAREGWLRTEDGRTVLAVRTAADATRRMPPDRPLGAAQRALLERWLSR